MCHHLLDVSRHSLLKIKEFDAEYIGRYKDKKDIPITKVGLWALFGTFIVKKLAPIFVSCSPVTPSQSVRDERELRVAIDKVTMDICTAWCSCTAGTGTLYKLEYSVSNLFTDPACTSMSWGWNKGTRKSVADARILDVRIRKDKRTCETKKRQHY